MASDDKKRYLDWNEVASTRFNSIHLSGNAYAAKYKVLKGQRAGYGSSCSKCKNDEPKDKKKKKKPEGPNTDPTQTDKIIYKPLYIGCERASISIPAEFGSFLDKPHAENIQYKINDKEYNPSNINDSFYNQITYSTNPQYSGFQGIIVENTCIPEYEKYTNMALSAKNKAREVAKAQILTSSYNENAYLSIYKAVSTGTEFQETFEVFSYFLTLVSSGIRSGKQEEYLGSFPTIYGNIRTEAEQTATALQNVDPNLETQEDIENFIAYIKSRVFSLYIQEDIGLRHIASEHGIIDAVGDLTQTEETTRFSPSVLDILDRTDATTQAYLDLYYAPDPRDPDNGRQTNKTMIPTTGAKENLVLNIPLDPFTR